MTAPCTELPVTLVQRLAVQRVLISALSPQVDRLLAVLDDPYTRVLLPGGRAEAFEAQTQGKVGRDNATGRGFRVLAADEHCVRRPALVGSGYRVRQQVAGRGQTCAVCTPPTELPPSRVGDRASLRTCRAIKAARHLGWTGTRRARRRVDVVCMRGPMQYAFQALCACSAQCCWFRRRCCPRAC